MLTCVLAWSLVSSEIYCLSLVVWGIVLLKSDDGGTSQWENSLCREFQVSWTVPWGSGVFSLSLCALGWCDLRGLPGICQRYLLQQAGAKVFLNGECVHSSKSKTTWVLGWGLACDFYIIVSMDIGMACLGHLAFSWAIPGHHLKVAKARSKTCWVLEVSVLSTCWDRYFYAAKI